MPNHRETNTYEAQADKFAEALATARQMQQDWLTYGLDFIHFYVEDANGDWLETWGNDEILGNSLLNAIKEFLISDDDVAVRIRQYIRDRSLFDLAVNLEECWRNTPTDDRLTAVINLLASQESSVDIDRNDNELLNLADSLLKKLAEI